MTFEARDSARARLAYAAVQAVGALATGALVWVLVNEAAAGGIAAYVVAIPPVTVGMFLANRAWAFADPVAAPENKTVAAGISDGNFAVARYIDK